MLIIVFSAQYVLESMMSSDALPLMRDLSQVGQSILGKKKKKAN